jgi:hypothetical protein
MDFNALSVLGLLLKAALINGSVALFRSLVELNPLL